MSTFIFRLSFMALILVFLKAHAIVDTETRLEMYLLLVPIGLVALVSYCIHRDKKTGNTSTRDGLTLLILYHLLFGNLWRRICAAVVVLVVMAFQWPHQEQGHWVDDGPSKYNTSQRAEHWVVDKPAD